MKMPAICLFVIAIFLPVAAHASEPYDFLPEGIREEVRSLSEEEKRALSLYARGKWLLKQDKLYAENSNKTGEDMQWFIKASASTCQLLSFLAADSRWPELEKWFKNEQEINIALIRGERDGAMKKYNDNVNLIARILEGESMENFERISMDNLDLFNLVTDTILGMGIYLGSKS